MEEAHTPLSPPRTLGSDPKLRDSYATQGYSMNTSVPMLDKTEGESFTSTQPKKKRWWLWFLAGFVALGVIVVAVIVPVYYKVIKPNQNDAENSNSGPVSQPGGSSPTNDEPGQTEPGTPQALTTGGDGSEVTFEDGTKYTYRNAFGGYWVSDPEDPFNNNARPNSWTPPLNTSWDYSKDRIQGVNLGGLFVIEPFIYPKFFQKYTDAIDEWTLSEAMAADTASGGLDQLEEHYKTFVTEQDIAEIAGAGLNWIRLPIPWWAIETWPGEPFLAKKSWPQILKVVAWCRKYGIRINLDLHTLPGGQSGYNHSGRQGVMNFLVGSMGVANAQRALSYIRVFTEFFSQPEYKDVVVMFGIVNEALVSSTGMDSIQSFYAEVHRMIREITGYGAGNGLYISLHDGFRGIGTWGGLLAGADRFALDSHPYFTFDGSADDSRIDTGLDPETAGGPWPARACERWGNVFNTSRSAFGVTYAGEWSHGFNDCALFLRGPKNPVVNYPGDCSHWQDASLWDEATIAGLKALSMAQMDAFRDWFFWTWKIGDSNKGHPESPLWSYKLGLERGWIPKDPREAFGQCARRGESGVQWDGSYAPSATGAVTAEVTQLLVQHPWPPLSLSSVGGAVVAASLLHSYVPTGAIVTLPPPEVTNAPDGWFNENDTQGMFVPQEGCEYYDAWDALNQTAPAVPCGITAAPAAATPTMATA